MSYVSSGLGVAGLATAGIVWLATRGDQSILETLKSPTGAVPFTPSNEALVRSLNQRTVTMDVGLIAGGALVLGGVGTFLLSNATDAKVTATVTVGPGAVGVTGKF